MKNRLLYIICIYLLSSTCKSQTPFSSWELGVFGGGSYYLGEVNQSHFSPLKSAFGPVIKYNYDQRLNVKIALTLGRIEGDDKNSNSSFNTSRNVSFKSDLLEVSSVLEFNFFPFSSLDPKSYLVTPYGYLGLAYLNHNPKIKNNGEFYSANLDTEGKSYSKHLLTIPMGLGIKFRMNRFEIVLDWGIRKTFTDYLDDVSTFYLPINASGTNNQQEIGNLTQYSDVGDLKRGDKYSKDWYIFTGITFFVNLSKEQICRSFN